MAEIVSARCDADRGRRIPRDSLLRLIGAAAGHCQSPLCNTGFLWREISDGSTVRLAEVAHIVAASVGGPRGHFDAAETELVAYDNLMLLCPTCHTIVDRAPDEYTAEILRSWKVAHEARVSELLGVARCRTRAEARTRITGLLDENRVVWQRYGPESAEAWKREVQAAWLNEVKEVVLPNNVRIGRLLGVNSHLLHQEEKEVMAEFAAHARALEQRHLAGAVNPAAPRLPTALNKVFSD